MNRILLIEDEKNVRESLADYFVREGFEVLQAGSLAEAARLAAADPGVVVLDWMLPDGQGIELLRQWRREGRETPVILLTARADLVDKVLGLELGANDYITKPFVPRELVARVRVQLRAKVAVGSATPAPAGQILASSGITLDSVSREVTYLGRRVELTKTEFDLLKLFLESPNQVFSREELLKQIWGYDRAPTTRTVDTHLLQLRQKTRADCFETVHKIGYRFRSLS